MKISGGFTVFKITGQTCISYKASASPRTFPVTLVSWDHAWALADLSQP